MPTISDVRHPLLYYDTNTLSLLLWDGSLQTGALTIGSVNQGTGGSSAWLVKKGFAIGAYDYLQITYTDATKATISTVVFRTGGAAGSIIATLTLTTDATHDSWTKT